MPDTEKIEDGRAHHAFQAAQAAQQKGESVADDYQSYAKDLPMRIKTNGLGAALAFVKAKQSDSDAYELLYDQLTDWLKTDERAYLLAEGEGTDLVERIVSLDSTAYRAVTREVLAYLSWLRRFAEGVIDTNE
jgi:CRISPR-associated protein Cmr5